MQNFSIIQKSKLEGALRLDAEYYQPEFLEAERFIASREYTNFGDIISLLTDYHANGSYEILRQHVELLDEPDYALMIRTTDLDNYNYIDGVKYVSESAYNFLKKTKLFGGEIIINKIGSTGNVYLMPKLNRPVSLGMNQFMIKLREGFSPMCIYVFLISKYGKRTIDRRITGTVPTSIDKDSIKSIKIPIFNAQFQKEIESVLWRADEIKYEARTLYQQAENMLLEELGLKDFDIEENLSTIVNFSDVMEARRMDAEYFQPKFQKLISKMEAQNHKRSGDLVSMKKGIEIGAEQYQDEGKLFIRVSSMTKFGIVESDQKYLSEKLYEELKKDFQPQVGEILLTKDATPGIAYVLKENLEGIISGGTLRLKLKEKIESEYVALCLSSVIGQMQAERDAGGSVIAHWKPEQIKNVVIPILPTEIQQKIAELVCQSHEARKKAKTLLEEAKKRVEYLIENQ